jgi:hypothetical protein
MDLSVMIADLLQRISLEMPDMRVRTEISPNVTISHDCPIIPAIESILKHVMLVCESKNVFVEAFQTLGLLNVRLTFFGLALSTDNHDLYDYVRKLAALTCSVAIDQRSCTASILVQAVTQMDDQI